MPLDCVIVSAALFLQRTVPCSAVAVAAGWQKEGRLPGVCLRILPLSLRTRLVICLAT